MARPDEAAAGLRSDSAARVDASSLARNAWTPAAAAPLNQLWLIEIVSASLCTCGHPAGVGNDATI